MTLIDFRERKGEQKGGSVLSERVMGAAKGSRRRILNEDENKSEQQQKLNFKNLSDL